MNDDFTLTGDGWELEGRFDYFDKRYLPTGLDCADRLITLQIDDDPRHPRAAERAAAARELCTLFAKR